LKIKIKAEGKVYSNAFIKVKEKRISRWHTIE